MDIVLYLILVSYVIYKIKTIRGFMGIIILNFKDISTTSYLKGSFSIALSSNMQIHDIKLFQKGDSRWITLPQREYLDKETGAKKYFGIVRFPDKEQSDSFQRVVLKAVDEYRAKNPTQQEKPRQEPVKQAKITEWDLPF
jgi:DNA-binding cell septation regulator SpoVG